jgi:hypothetical protein
MRTQMPLRSGTAIWDISRIAPEAVYSRALSCQPSISTQRSQGAEGSKLTSSERGERVSVEPEAAPSVSM